MNKVGVVGCGLMGSGIAEVSARAGLDVVVLESSQDRVDAGVSRLEKSLQRAESRGKLGSATAAEVLGRELGGAGLGRQRGQPLGNLRDRQTIGLTQDRHDQAALGVHGDADVDVLLVDDLVVVEIERGVEQRLAALVKEKTRDEWSAIMAGSDVCFAPVLTMSEAAEHPHNVHRSTYVELDGISQPAPAPRFSRTAPQLTTGPAWPGEHTDAVLVDWGFGEDEVAKLRASGAVR